MTFEELLKSCSKGELPVVVYKSITGRVTVIKNTEGFRGCAVKLDDMPYDSWFYAEPGKDKRMKYMSDLTFKQHP